MSIKILDGDNIQEIPTPDVNDAFSLALYGAAPPDETVTTNLICISRMHGEPTVRVVVSAPAPKRSHTRIFDLSSQDEDYRQRFFDALREGIIC